MSKGQRYPSESRETTDPESGRRIRQVTSHPSIHHHPYFFVRAYDDAMKRLIFVSHRTGTPQIFFEDRATGELVQVTDRPDLAEWSLYPSADGRYVYFTAGNGAWRADLGTLQEEQLADFGAGSSTGTTALSQSGRWWAIPVTEGNAARLMVIDTASKTASVAVERDALTRPQFCPDDDDLILYTGSPTDRMWLTDRSGKSNRRLYEREDKMQWVTHEVWVPGRRTVAFVDWPNGMRMIDVDRGVFRWLIKFPCWHAAPDDQGMFFVCDTNDPDQGLHTYDIDDEDDVLPLCQSLASSEGRHWRGPFPYNEGPPPAEAAQHTHPHPRFAPDNSRVLFTSDRTGHAQLYEVMLENGR